MQGRRNSAGRSASSVQRQAQLRADVGLLHHDARRTPGRSGRHLLLRSRLLLGILHAGQHPDHGSVRRSQGKTDLRSSVGLNFIQIYVLSSTSHLNPSLLAYVTIVIYRFNTNLILIYYFVLWYLIVIFNCLILILTYCLVDLFSNLAKFLFWSLT